MTEAFMSGETPISAAPIGTLTDEVIRRALEEVVGLYPPALRPGQMTDIKRIATHISIIAQRVGPASRICDLGGGIGLFAPGCARLGMKATLVDDFSDAINHEYSIETLGIHRKLGVEVVSCDVLSPRLSFPPGSFDAVTTFDSMEHWHGSPKRLFREITKWLRPGGLFMLGVPNCVNLRKRITVPLGIGKWSQMHEWYEAKSFRGHVREPDVDDLLHIARDMSLADVEILGYNWIGYVSRHSFARVLTPIFDKLLRRWPSLCADIYVLGRKSE